MFDKIIRILSYSLAFALGGFVATIGPQLSVPPAPVARRANEQTVRITGPDRTINFEEWGIVMRAANEMADADIPVTIADFHVYCDKPNRHRNLPNQNQP